MPFVTWLLCRRLMASDASLSVSELRTLESHPLLDDAEAAEPSDDSQFKMKHSMRHKNGVDKNADILDVPTDPEPGSPVHDDPEMHGLSLYEKKALIVNRELASQGMGKYQWMIFFLCGFGYFLDLLWAQAFGLILASVQQEFGFSAAQSGDLGTAFSAGLTAGAAVSLSSQETSRNNSRSSGESWWTSSADTGHSTLLSSQPAYSAYA